MRRLSTLDTAPLAWGLRSSPRGSRKKKMRDSSETWKAAHDFRRGWYTMCWVGIRSDVTFTSTQAVRINTGPSPRERRRCCLLMRMPKTERLRHVAVVSRLYLSWWRDLKTRPRCYLFAQRKDIIVQLTIACFLTFYYFKRYLAYSLLPPCGLANLFDHL